MKPRDIIFICMRKGFNAIPIARGAKEAKYTFGKGMLEPYFKNHYEWTDRYLDGDYNVGIVTGKTSHNLAVLDIDSDDIAHLFLDNFNTIIHETFSVKTGRGYHIYYQLDESIGNECKASFYRPGEDYEPNEQGKMEHKAHTTVTVKCQGGYVIAPGSLHPSGIEYTTICEKLPIKIPAKEFVAMFERNARKVCKMKGWSLAATIKDEPDEGEPMPLRLEDIAGKGLRRCGNELVGSHPVHGSEGGHNFCINPNKQIWHCFRCNSGGGLKSWLLVQEHVIECEDAGKGVLSKHGIDVDKILEEKYNIKKPKFRKMGDDKPKPYAVAGEIMKNYFFKTICDEDEEIYVYLPEDGLYHSGAKQLIKKCVYDILDENASSHYINEVICAIQAQTYVKREAFDADKNLIWIKNGIFNMATGALERFGPSRLSWTSIPVVYDPEAKCEVFTKFVGEIVKEEDIQHLQEMFAYCLLRDNRYQVAYMMIGGGANGKSTLMGILRAMLGEDNVSGVALQSFSHDLFAASALYLKMANIYDEIPKEAMKYTGVFKAIVTGDPISIQRKYGHRFQASIYAKLIFSTNELPRSYDNSDAYYRRWVIIQFPNQFLMNADRMMPAKLETELSGIFNWMVEGMKRMNEKGTLTYNKLPDETRQLYKKLSSPFSSFCSECIREEMDGHVTRDELYEKYCAYCRDNNLSPESSQIVYKQMMIDSVARTEKRTINGARVNVYCNIKIVIPDEKEEDERPPESSPLDRYGSDGK